MPLGKKADAGDYVDDFKKSKAPQFKGKSQKKRKEMAIAAYLSSKNELAQLVREVMIEELLGENYKDGKRKGKSRPGRVKKSGASCKGSVSSLRAKAKKYGGEKGKMYHWCANMKGGKKK